MYTTESYHIWQGNP